jgi:serine/threonine protein phosphatase 1
MESKRIIAFGDVHGCYQAAEAAVQLAKKEEAIAIFLGDYVDRGPDSIKTLEVLIDAKKQNPTWFFLRGNHDQMLLDLILDRQKPNTFFNVISGKTSNEETSKVFLQWQTCNGTLKRDIVTFLQETKFYHETEHWIFVHASLKDNTIPLNKKSEEELIWNYDLNPIWEGSRFVHGHYTTEEITYNGQGININTLCGYGGVLTGILIDINNKQNIIVHYSISEDGQYLNNITI